MFITKWDLRYINLAAYIRRWSKDPSTQVGCVIASKGNSVVSLGINGFPKGIPDEECLLTNREEKYPRTIHGELNAILFAQRDLHDCTLYVYPLPPCGPCASVITQVGIRRVISIKPDNSGLAKRWDDTVTLDIFKKADVSFILVDPSQID